jgi:hypothetical protein
MHWLSAEAAVFPTILQIMCRETAVLHMDLLRRLLLVACVAAPAKTMPEIDPVRHWHCRHVVKQVRLHLLRPIKATDVTKFQLSRHYRHVVKPDKDLPLLKLIKQEVQSEEK